MSLTARELFDQIRDLRPKVEEAIQAESEIAAHLPRLRLERDEKKLALDRAEANAFLVAKSQKATDETARRMAKLDQRVQDAERAYSESCEAVRTMADKRDLAHTESKAWGGLVEANAAVSWSLNRELKMAGVGTP